VALTDITGSKRPSITYNKDTEGKVKTNKTNIGVILQIASNQLDPYT